MGSKEYGRASPGSQTLPLGPVSLPLSPHSHPRARGQNPPPSLQGRRQQTRDATEAEVRVHGGLPTHAVETLGKEQSCWLMLVSVFA